MYLNKCILIGNLTKTPELKVLPSGIKVVNFSLATNRSWKDKDGQKKEDVEFHNLVAFGKTAEIIEQWIKKGDQIYIEGRLQTRNWEDKETGKKLYRTEVIVDTFQFGAKRGKAEEKDKNGTEAVDDTESSATGQNSPNTGTTDGGDIIDPSDIPF